MVEISLFWPIIPNRKRETFFYHLTWFGLVRFGKEVDQQLKTTWSIKLYHLVLECFKNLKIQKVKKSIQIVYYILIIAYQYVKNWIFIGNDMNFTFLITGWTTPATFSQASFHENHNAFNLQSDTPDQHVVGLNPVFPLIWSLTATGSSVENAWKL